MDQGVDKAMVFLSVNSPHKDILLWESEPIYCNGELLGSVTSTAYNHWLNKPFCLGMLGLITNGRKSFNQRDMLKQGLFEVDMQKDMYLLKL